MNIFKSTVAAAALLSIAPLAQAQFAETKSLTIDGARRVIAATVAAATNKKTTGVIAVVDNGGNLMALERIDGTFAAGANISIGKARTALLFQKPTKVFEDLVNKGRTAMVALDGFTPLQGGVPITVDGQIVGAVGVSGAASAQQYPTRPFRMIVPYPPGGGIDIVLRLIQPKLARSLGETMVIDNRPGASGSIAMELAARATPDVCGGRSDSSPPFSSSKWWSGCRPARSRCCPTPGTWRPTRSAWGWRSPRSRLPIARRTPNIARSGCTGWRYSPRSPTPCSCSASPAGC